MPHNSETLYKALDEDRQPFHGGAGQWPEIGEWRSVKGKLEPCVNGLHVARLDQLLEWLSPRIYEVEVSGKVIDDGDKLVVRRARLVRDTGWTVASCRLFTADCAEHVLHLFERWAPDDRRPRQAIAAARAFARGEIDGDARAAAWAAAWAAARAAAGAAAWAAARAAAWDAARAAARAAAWDAAGAAAWAAAGDAARAAARDAEKQWQIERLGQYLRGEPLSPAVASEASRA